MEHIDRLRDLLGKVNDLVGIASVLEWDQNTYMPDGGAETRASQRSLINRIAHERFVSDEVGAALEAAKGEAASLDPDSDAARLVRRVSRDFDKARRVPAEWVEDMFRISTLSQAAWQQARAESDYGKFKPHLQAIVSRMREYVSFFGSYDHMCDPLLDRYEPGTDTATVSSLFDQLRTQQLELVHSVTKRGTRVDASVLHQPYDIRKQRDFGIEVAKAIGYDMHHGRLDTSAHPFTINFGREDVRITTRFDPNYIGSSLFSILHESGHGMYDQGIGRYLARVPVLLGNSLTASGVASMGIHESQSRLWENLVGRSRPFWTFFYPRLKKTFPRQLRGVDLDTFYHAINRVKPSLIRTEADEATYNLHIMLRFDLEILLISGRLALDDLPEAWNAKMREYMGLTPGKDAEGVLQDIHWSIGYFGYFPTYSLGNLMAAQLWEKISADIPDLAQQIEHGRFGSLLAWLREKIHQPGAKYEAQELIQRATGKPLTPDPYLRYLKTKFGEIYRL